MANSKPMDPRQSKYNDAGSIYYHCTALKKLLDKHDSVIFQSLKSSLEIQELAKPPHGNCYICGSDLHWAPNCSEKKTVETISEKPPYGQCYNCGSTSHWAPKCPHSNDNKRTYPFKDNSEIPNKRTKIELPSDSDQKKDDQKPKPTSNFVKHMDMRPYFQALKQKDDELITPIIEKKKKSRTQPYNRSSKRTANKNNSCFLCKQSEHLAKDCKEIEKPSD